MAKVQIFLDPDNPFIHDLTEDKVTVGRLADNAIHMDEASVSSHHAEVIHKDGQYHLHDLGSTNGTFVNGEQVTDAVLHNGDKIRFGKIEVHFTDNGTETADQPLPESSQVEIIPGQASVPPKNFVSSSPFARNIRKRDPVGMAMMILALVGFLAFVGVVVNILMMQTSI